MRFLTAGKKMMYVYRNFKLFKGISKNVYNVLVKANHDDLTPKNTSNDNSKIPGIKSTEQENGQSHDALCVPPLDTCWGWGRKSRSWCLSWTAGLDQTQQTGVTLPV